MTDTMPVDQVRFVKELYPRLKPHDDVVERYRDALAKLPPIIVARDGVLVDGYHRWQAHVREGVDTVAVENLGNLTDAEIIRESIRRNATHGQQLSSADKKRMAAHLWVALADLDSSARVKDIAELLAVSERSVQDWTKDVRKVEKERLQDRAWDLWLDCHDYRSIALFLGGPDEDTIGRWLSVKAQDCVNADAPESRQHFDIWQFATADQDAGQQSYFGALPPQVVENLLWFYTDPGQIVVDMFAGSGTTIDVAKTMSRRVWASDIRGDHYSPHLPIHAHDITTGWPDDAPRKADLILLDPPYWQQARGQYGDDPADLGNMQLDVFRDAWNATAKTCMAHTDRIAYIISPSQLEDGTVVDHATEMLAPFDAADWLVERRIIVPYSTQQATGQQVTWARDNRRMLKLYRDLVVMRR
jgi:DNA methylase